MGPTPSSEKYKENIMDIKQSTIEKFDSIRHVEFNFKNNKYKSYGIIAEELFEIFPELVVINKNNTPEGISEPGLIGLLFGMIKDLLKRVSELEK